jgi:sec-independent protein translocase protein TatA
MLAIFQNFSKTIFFDFNEYYCRKSGRTPKYEIAFSDLNMAFDDPVIWVMIAALAIFLFGANKIPSLARSLGQARREFDKASKGQMDEIKASISKMDEQTTPDPLLEAAQREGIEIEGKTKQQIASELSWKLNKGQIQP